MALPVIAYVAVLLSDLESGVVPAGAALLGVTSVLIAKERIRPDAPVILENAGIYWHLVDTIWIIILPLFYLAA